MGTPRVRAIAGFIGAALLAGAATPSFAGYTIEFDGAYVVRSIDMTDQFTFDEGKFKHTFTNTGPDSTTFRMVITTEYTGTTENDHSWTMCNSVACVSPDIESTIRLGPAESDTVTVKVFSLTDTGSSTSILSFSEESGGTVTEFSYGVISTGSEVIVIDDSLNGAYGAGLAAGIEAAGMTYGVFDGSIENIGNSQVDLSMADMVVYTSGDQAAGILSGSDVAAFSGYLDGGGTLLMSGQHLFDDLDGSGFATDYLGVIRFGATTQTTVLGVSGDPVGNGLALDLTAGAGTPTGQDVLGGSTAFLRYADASNAGIRNNPAGGFNAYSLGFGVELLSAAHLAALVNAISTAGSSVPTEVLSWSEVKDRFRD